MIIPYSHEAPVGYQIAQLPITASALSMIIILLTNDDSSTATSSEVLNTLGDLNSTKVQVRDGL